MNKNKRSTKTLMKAALKIYKVLLTPVKRNKIYPEQVNIIALTSIVKKLKYVNLKLSRYFKVTSKRVNGKVKSHNIWSITILM